MKKWFLGICTLVLALGALPDDSAAQRGRRGGGPSNRADMNTMERPIPIANKVWMEDLTVMEIRDLVRDGWTTALVLTGGIESNGPYLVTGKHNFVLAATGEPIARSLGNALVAPIITVEPGNPETASTPGGIRYSQETYRAVLRDYATSLKAQGFANIVFFGDSGGNQTPMREVAEALNAEWGGQGARVHFITEYYTEDQWSCDYIKDVLGIVQQPDVCTATRDLYHDDVHYSSIVATTDAERIRPQERLATDQFSINGVSLAPVSRTLEVGKKLIEYRTEITVRAIRAAIASQ